LTQQADAECREAGVTSPGGRSDQDDYDRIWDALPDMTWEEFVASAQEPAEEAA